MAAHDLPPLSPSALAREKEPITNPLFHGKPYDHTHSRSLDHQTIESVPRSFPYHLRGARDALQQPTHRKSASFDERSSVANSVVAQQDETSSSSVSKMSGGTTELRAGVVQKPFTVSTQALVNASPYFASLRDPASKKSTFSMKAIVNPNEEAMPNEHDDEHHDRSALFEPIPTERTVSIAGPFYFPDIDEFSFELFVDWINNGKLHGPDDFHSMTHYVVLYIIAQRFQIEKLENHAMDLIRGYYRENKMTAPAFRLEYIYRNTEGACLLRDFFVHTAVYRALTERGPEHGTDMRVSTSIQNALRRGKDLAVDYAVVMANFQAGMVRDVRLDDNAKWHVHKATAATSDVAF